jgi:hypothetical protein
MGAIINIFKSIIGLITGLFSGGKKSKDGFYMEAPAVNAPAAQSASTPAVQPVVATASVTAPDQKGGVPKKAAKGKAGQAAAAAAVAVATAVTAAPKPVDAVDLIRAALASSQATPAEQAAQAEASASFAEMNAVPYTTGNRRRPGANMTGFLDLAKTMGKR